MSAALDFRVQEIDDCGELERFPIMLAQSAEGISRRGKEVGDGRGHVPGSGVAAREQAAREARSP